VHALEIAVDLLATYRLTRLATADAIGEPARLAVEERRGEDSKLATLVRCRWCAGMWIAGGVVLARHLVPKAWDPMSKALAFSAGAGLLAALEDD
jgi:hypothetical protein